MGWRTDADESGGRLLLGRGIVAIDVPASWAPAVRATLERVERCTPALLLATTEPRVVFLAEADTSVLGQFQLPVGARFLTAPTMLRLPLASTAEQGGTIWYCPPDPAHRWLFPAGAVLQAVESAAAGGDASARPRRAGNSLFIG
ncbi:hypothetical protein [Lentzea jiangxiensis]|nr:hypothetical protein [Lentzea jiangxiensis]